MFCRDLIFASSKSTPATVAGMCSALIIMSTLRWILYVWLCYCYLWCQLYRLLQLSDFAKSDKSVLLLRLKHCMSCGYWEQYFLYCGMQKNIPSKWCETLFIARFRAVADVSSFWFWCSYFSVFVQLVTPDVMLVYLRIFIFLWRAKRMEHQLALIWTKTMDQTRKLAPNLIHLQGRRSEIRDVCSVALSWSGHRFACFKGFFTSVTYWPRKWSILCIRCNTTLRLR